jgi:hypothetical protein
MKVTYRKFTAPIALLVTFALAQLYIGAGLAESNYALLVSATTPAPLMGILSTRDNKPIMVNGASAITGATIPTGATIETPNNVSATIKLGVLGNICIAPNTKLVLEFNRTGNAGNVQVALSQGCVILRTLKGTAGSITSVQGTIGQISAATGGSIDVCLRAGSAPAINQGAASDAGAGASALDCGAAGAAAVPHGFPLAATLAIIGGGATALVLAFAGSNPSPTSP